MMKQVIEFKQKLIRAN